jgi:hypothetical protein
LARTLFVTAGVAALYHMPKLKKMEIWAIGEKCGFLFRVHMTDKVEILCKKTKNLPLSLSVVISDRERLMRDTRPQQKLTVRRQRWEADLEHHADGLQCLDGDVIDPVSFASD